MLPLTPRSLVGRVGVEPTLRPYQSRVQTTYTTRPWWTLGDLNPHLLLAKQSCYQVTPSAQGAAGWTRTNDLPVSAFV